MASVGFVILLVPVMWRSSSVSSDSSPGFIQTLGEYQFSRSLLNTVKTPQRKYMRILASPYILKEEKKI